MTELYREAFTEVNEILKYLNEDLLKKIPKEIIDNIKENKSTSYKIEYDNTKGLNEQSLKQETRAILSVIYRDYICNEYMKKEIIQKDRKEWFEAEKKKEYEDIDIFKKQNIIIKILDKIKIIWRKIRG